MTARQGRTVGTDEAADKKVFSLIAISDLCLSLMRPMEAALDEPNSQPSSVFIYAMSGSAPIVVAFDVKLESFKWAGRPGLQSVT